MRRDLMLYPFLEMERFLEYAIIGNDTPNPNFVFGPTNTISWARYVSISEREQDHNLQHITAGRRLSINLKWKECD